MLVEIVGCGFLLYPYVIIKGSMNINVISRDFSVHVT